MTRLLAVLPMITVALYADYLTTVDNKGYFGRVKSLKSNVVEFTANFPDGWKSFSVQLSDIRRIDFNDTTYNSGEPPKALAARPTSNPKASPIRNETPVGDTIFLRGNDSQSCRVDLIDQSIVKCDKKTFNREFVIFITLQTRR